MSGYIYDESVQVCDDSLLEAIDSELIKQNDNNNKDDQVNSLSSSTDSESELSYISDHSSGRKMADEGQNPSNGQVFQEKIERPITRTGATRQKNSAQQKPSTSTGGRPGTAGRNAGSSRHRPPSPEPSEAADDDDDDYEEDLNDTSNMEGPDNNNYKHLLPIPSSSGSDVTLDESLVELFKMADYTDMTSHEFTEMLNLFPENIDFLPERNPAILTDEDKEVQDALVKKRWVELVLEQKREMLRIEARKSRNPGVHGIKEKGGMYKAEDYANLNTTPEIKQLFEYITKYLPAANMQAEVKFKPFIREYEASVGDIDAFIKVLHPDIANDGLGIKVLDEPSAFQSDPSVLDLRLRSMAKQSSAKAVNVKKVENAHKNTKIIDNWIKDISDLHRSKPSPSVHYSKPMPDIDTLLQEWPPEFEDLLKNATTPDATLDCDLKTYVDLVCNLLDIPVYKSRIQSLHVLATLYATQKEFNSYGQFGGPGGDSQGQAITPTTFRNDTNDRNVDRLEF